MHRARRCAVAVAPEDGIEHRHGVLALEGHPNRAVGGARQGAGIPAHGNLTGVVPGGAVHPGHAVVVGVGDPQPHGGPVPDDVRRSRRGTRGRLDQHRHDPIEGLHESVLVPDAREHDELARAAKDAGEGRGGPIVRPDRLSPCRRRRLPRHSCGPRPCRTPGRSAPCPRWSPCREPGNCIPGPRPGPERRGPTARRRNTVRARRPPCHAASMSANSGYPFPWSFFPRVPVSRPDHAPG